MRNFAAITKALASEKRLRILMALRGGSLSESVLTALLGLSPSTVSKHLWVLRRARLVESDKAGRCVCYRLAPGEPGGEVGPTLQWLQECLGSNPQMQRDRGRVATLSRRSSVQAECRGRRQSLAIRLSRVLTPAARPRGASNPER